MSRPSRFDADAADTTSRQLARQLAGLPREDALRVARNVRSRLAELELVEPDVNLLARLAAGWWSALEDLAKRDPVAAGDLARGMFNHLARFRPEAPAPLDAGFSPTESVPTGPPRAA